MSRKIIVSDEEIIKAANEAPSATKAAQLLNIKYETYKIHATRLNVFKKNQSGKGIKKPIEDSRKILLLEILEGKHPHYQSNKLRKRLIKEKIKPHMCELCGIKEWLGQEISLELDHIDGNRYNHVLSNLRILCPNCHSQTETYRGKNKSGCGGTGIRTELKILRH